MKPQSRMEIFASLIGTYPSSMKAAPAAKRVVGVVATAIDIGGSFSGGRLYQASSWVSKQAAYKTQRYWKGLGLGRLPAAPIDQARPELQRNSPALGASGSGEKAAGCRRCRAVGAPSAASRIGPSSAAAHRSLLSVADRAARR
jgi:hypothetical protein